MAMEVKNISVETEKGSEEAIEIKLWNGELQVLNDIVKGWNFKDKESALRFAIAILARSTDHVITVHQNGQQSPLLPADNLLVKSDDGSTT